MESSIEEFVAGGSVYVATYKFQASDDIIQVLFYYFYIIILHHLLIHSFILYIIN